MLKRRGLSLVACILMMTLLTITSFAQRSDDFSDEMLRISEMVEENKEDGKALGYFKCVSQEVVTLAKDIPFSETVKWIFTGEDIAMLSLRKPEEVKNVGAEEELTKVTEVVDVTESTKVVQEITEMVEETTEDIETDLTETESVSEVHYYQSGDLAPKGELTFENIPVEDYEWDGDIINSYAGTVEGPSGKETYYNLPMSGVIAIMEDLGYTGEYSVREDGAKMLGDFIMVAAELGNRPKGTIIKTSMGWAVVADTGGFVRDNPTQLDIATAW